MVGVREARVLAVERCEGSTSREEVVVEMECRGLGGVYLGYTAAPVRDRRKRLLG